MRRFLAITLSSLLLVACSAAPAVAPASAPDATGEDTAGEPSLGLPGLPGSELRPSGARVRIVNAYAPLNGPPGAIDIFPGVLIPQNGQGPLATVGYGQVSDWFDPGADSDGNAALSWYPGGRHSDADQLGSQTATLKGDERITIFVATGENTTASGARFAQWRAVYEKGGDASFPLATPAASGKAVLLMESVGLQNTYGGEDQALLLSTGKGCLFEQGVVPGQGTGPKPVGGGTSAAFEVDPGTLRLSVHAYPSGVIEGEIDCTVPAVLKNVAVTLHPGGRAFLLLYATGKTDLKALVVPIED